MAKISQQTIADSLGVSQAIVSGVLNGKSVRASEETRQRIQAKAKELGYKKPKRQLKQPDLIAFIVHSETWQNCLPVMRGMNRFLAGQNTLIVQHEWLTEEMPTGLLDNVKGCISSSAEMAENREAVAKFSAKVPLVFLLAHDNSGCCDSVFQDATPAYRTALQHLWNLGHRRFGYFGIRNMGQAQAFQVGSFHTAIMELDFPQPEPGWVYLPYRREATDADTRQRLRDYLDLITACPQRPTAIFFEADLYARFFQEEAAHYHLHVPNDISIVGHTGEDTWGNGVSTMARPYEDIGFTAMKALHDRIATPDLPVTTYRLPELWTPGDSLAKARKS
jgi:LacI family transcriptional regulator